MFGFQPTTPFPLRPSSIRRLLSVRVPSVTWSGRSRPTPARPARRRRPAPGERESSGPWPPTAPGPLPGAVPATAGSRRRRVIRQSPAGRRGVRAGRVCRCGTPPRRPCAARGRRARCPVPTPGAEEARVHHPHRDGGDDGQRRPPERPTLGHNEWSNSPPIVVRTVRLLDPPPRRRRTATTPHTTSTTPVTCRHRRTWISADRSTGPVAAPRASARGERAGVPRLRERPAPESSARFRSGCGRCTGRSRTCVRVRRSSGPGPGRCRC